MAKTASARKRLVLPSKTAISSKNRARVFMVAAFCLSLAGIRLLAAYIPFWTGATSVFREGLTAPYVIVEGTVALALATGMGVVGSRRMAVTLLLVWACFLNVLHLSSWPKLDGHYSANPRHSLTDVLEANEKRHDAWVTSFYAFYAYLGANYPGTRLIVGSPYLEVVVPWFAEGLGRATMTVDASFNGELSPATRDKLMKLHHLGFSGNDYVKYLHVYETGLNVLHPEFQIHRFGNEIFIAPIGFVKRLEETL